MAKRVGVTETVRTLVVMASLLGGVAPSATAAPLTSKEEVLWASLRARVEKIAGALDGVVGLSVKDLQSGATIDIRAGETFPPASSIKLAVLYELYRQAEEGRIDLAETTQPPAARVAGAGVLHQLGPSVHVTWRDLAVMMMGWSDNEATNLLIGRLGLEAVNARLDALSLPQTRLRRRMMDVAAAQRGLENVSTPAEMRQLMEHLHAGTALSAARAEDLRKVGSMAKRSAFREVLPESVRVLDKTGDLEAVRCVSALVLLPKRPYAVSIMTTYLRQDADGGAAIREISAALYSTFDRLDRSSELGRIVSER